MNRKLDVEIAVNKYGWQWVNPHGTRSLLVPPDDSHMRLWSAIWDQDGIPHYLPEYSKEMVSDVSNYYKSILKDGHIKVPRNYVTDILIMLHNNSKDAQVIPIDDNSVIMLLVHAESTISHIHDYSEPDMD
jgi:hypothetical protein